MQIITVLLIAVSLSMDAFSLSLLYGTLNLNKKDIKKLSIIVGIYHFIMPLIGYLIGNILNKILLLNSNLIVFIVLFIIGLQMILETFKDNNEIKILNLKESLLFGFAVSIDSLSIGIGLKQIYSNIFISIIIFSITSFIFTYIGLLFGKKINNVIGKISTLIGGIILMIVGLFYII